MAADGAGAVAALARRSLARGALAWAVGMGLLLASVVAAYEGAYPQPADRLSFARNFSNSSAFAAVLGPTRRLETVGGFVAWRIGMVAATMLAVWSLLAVTRSLRGEEDAGRWELLLAGPVTPLRATAATLGVILQAIALQAVVAAVTLLALGTAADLPVTDCLLLVAVLESGAVWFGAVAALTVQLAPTRRGAAGMAGASLAVAFLVRVIADGAGTASWLRWCTPLGWAEEVRPFAGGRAAPLALLVVTAAGLVATALFLAARRDSGGAVLRDRSVGPTDGRLLGAPEALQARLLRGTLAGWVAGTVALAVVAGLLANSAARALRHSGFGEQFSDLLGGSLTASAYVSFSLFQILALLLAFIAAGQVAAARDEEATGRLDLTLAGVVERRRWLAGRVALAVLVLGAVAAAAALAGWAAAASQGVPLTLGRFLIGGANALTPAALYLGVGVLGFGLRPRLAAASAYALIVATYLLELVGSLVDAPSCLLDVSPFHHLAVAPLQPVNLRAAAVMVSVGLACAGLGVVAFHRRDLVGP